MKSPDMLIEAAVPKQRAGQFLQAWRAVRGGPHASLGGCLLGRTPLGGRPMQ